MLKRSFLKYLLFFIIIIEANAAITFAGLGASDSGGTGYKSLTDANIVVSNDFTQDGTTLYYNNASDASKTLIIKTDGVDAESFDISELNIFAFNANGLNIDSTSTIVFKDKNSNTLRTMTLNGNKSLAQNVVTDIFAMFDNNAVSPVTGVSIIEFNFVFNGHGANGNTFNNLVFKDITYTNVVAPGASDTTAPSFENSTPSQNSINHEQVVINADINEAGKVYAIVIGDNMTAPNSAQVKAGVDYDLGNGREATVYSKGELTLDSGTFSNTLTLTGLTANTSYDVYVVAEDDEGTPNLQSSPSTKIDITTTAVPDTTPPTVQSITLLNSPTQNATSLTYQITFNENVSSVTTDDFNLTTTGSVTGTIASVSSATGTNMNVTINSVDGIGTLKLNLKANTNIVDDSGNGNNTNGYVSQFTNGDTHTAVVVDHDAQLVANNGVDESVEIKLPSTSNTLAEKVDLLDFTISDGGTSDSYTTDISEIRVNVIGTTTDLVRSKIKWLLNGNDASNVEGQYDSTNDVIKFSSLNISVANNSSENYIVSAYFQNPTGLTDNSTIGLSVDGDSDLTFDVNKTRMSSSNTAVTNSTNAKVDITATKLIIIKTPSKIAEVN